MIQNNNFKEIINYYNDLSRSDKSSDNYELEIRFGYFYNSLKNKNKKNFHSGVTKDIYENIINKHKIFESKNIKTEELIYDYIDNNRNDNRIRKNVKKSHILNEKNYEYLVKEKIKTFDIYDYNLRICISKESLLNNNEYEDYDNGLKIGHPII